MSEHALLSPSGAHRWMACPASVALERGSPDSSSDYADEGTAAHVVAQRALTYSKPAKFFLNEQIALGESGMRRILVDAEMASYVQIYLDNLAQYAHGNEVMVERRVPISQITGEEEAAGTSDAIVITADGEELQVHDLKYGKGVLVSAHENEQLMLYAVGALEEFGLLGDFKRVRLVIHQPRASTAPSEWDCTVEILQAFAARATAAAEKAFETIELMEAGELSLDHFAPGEEQCKFCKAKGKCPALQQHVLATVTDDFVDLDQIKPKLEVAFERVSHSDNAAIGKLLPHLGLIEDWCNAVRHRAEAELLAGNAVPGYKLVEGKRGNRAWTDEAAAEEKLKTMRVKHEQMYQYKLINPTAAEKLHQTGAIGPRQWPALQELITRSDGKPTVAPESDKRPAIEVKPVVDDFAAVDPVDACADLV